MHLKSLELNGFKSFAKKSEFVFDVPIIAIVGPNGSGKSNVVEAIRFVLGEQSVKSMRGKIGSDLIFKGSKEISQMSRASVTIVFDNKDRVFQLHNNDNSKISVDFDEVVITREVYSDGANKYLINGTDVRMKDVHELIASVNIGSSGHHIISQGEADRYLNANAKERRALIEEALGLKVYQYRLKTSTRKLEKAENNLRESEIMRRELAPHLRFLKRQVDKIEKAKELRINLIQRYVDYFTKEDALISRLRQTLQTEAAKIDGQYTMIQSFVSDWESRHEGGNNEFDTSALKKNLQEQADLRSEESMIARDIGRVEGVIDMLKHQQDQKPSSQADRKLSFFKVRDFIKSVIAQIENKISPDELKKTLHSFVERYEDIEDEGPSNDKDIAALESELAELQKKKSSIEAAQQKLSVEQLELEQARLAFEQDRQEQQQEYYQKLAEKKEIEGKMQLLQTRKDALEARVQARTEEFTEACILVGEQSLRDIGATVDVEESTKEDQEQARREIERMKIRLEDMGGGSGHEVVSEYQETVERDAFLEQEMKDIQRSIDSLQDLIQELKNTLNTEFESGVKKINVEFNRFFKLMFGGGKAKLDPVEIKKRKRKSDDEPEDNEETEESPIDHGIDIRVELPRKKVSDLDMLSGGERSLTSIALLFALSQVNPPPFLVLDETDAALDEANSQRYGDMVEQLSKFSQLIVVTHNRETMSRAHTLFGVTLGRDDASTLLSLRLEDATKYAK
jgi:chromosome segregation protein